MDFVYYFDAGGRPSCGSWTPRRPRSTCSPWAPARAALPASSARPTGQLGLLTYFTTGSLHSNSVTPGRTSLQLLADQGQQSIRA